MTRRPHTQEHLDAALDWIENDPTPDAGVLFGKDSFRTVLQPERVVAAEVRYLQKELMERTQECERWKATVEGLGNRIRELEAEDERASRRMEAYADQSDAYKAELKLHEKYAGERNYCDSCGKHILNTVTAHGLLIELRDAADRLSAAWSSYQHHDIGSDVQDAADNVDAVLAKVRGLLP
jgi:hypothetical protein